VGDYLGGIGEYARWRGKQRSEFYTDSQLKEDYKETVRYVINRRNTVTGQLYKDDKAILAWEFGNEMRRAPLEWEAEMANYIKSLDSNHLVMAGNDSRVPVDPPDNIDIVTRHYYGVDWEEAVRKDRAIAKGKRPFIVGEYGLEKDVDLMRRFHEETHSNGTSGSLIWSLYSHHRFGGFYWHQIFTDPAIGAFHWPGFESGAAHNERQMLGILREFGFRMQGLEVPEVSIPKIPSILPMTEDLPFITWRGSAGASGYDIERSEDPYDSWITVESNVSDAQVAYRPLFVDASVELDRDYYYRVRARNAAGVSEPSSWLGPVRFRSRVYVDELQDLSKVTDRSDGLVLDNSYNGLYAEYLFRCKGDEGDFLEYAPNGKSSRIRIWVFFSEGESSPEVSYVNESGETIAVELNSRNTLLLKSFKKVRQLVDSKRTMVQYEAVFNEPATEIRIDWAGSMELDRVEIEFQP
jgi:hypothetical protein